MVSIQKAAFGYLAALILFLYGFAVARFQIPPYAFLNGFVAEIEAYIAGDAIDRDKTVLQKIMSDSGIVPYRFLGRYPRGIGRRHTPLSLSGLNSRRELPQIYIDNRHEEGYRVIVGALDFENSFWGAVLISPEGKPLHNWYLSTEHLPGNSTPDINKVLYGTHVGSDGSIIFSMQEEAGGLVKVDVCSNELWRLPGSYHHTVTSDGDGAFWSFTGKQSAINQNMVKVSEETGEILKTINMGEVRRKNKGVHLWNLRYPYLKEGAEIFQSDHLTHGNDIEPLTEELAAGFEQFEVGDLLISYATNNLVFILDPDTLEVKWWRVGVGDFQHDPDWEPDGHISLFNNQARLAVHGAKFSEIVSIDPKTYESRVIYSGEDNHFMSGWNGSHQLTRYGTRMITSSAQGWAFEVDEAGDTVFSFINLYDHKGNKTLFISDALRLPLDYFEGKPWEDC